jgi:hypothetical protein
MHAAVTGVSDDPDDDLPVRGDAVAAVENPGDA